MPKMSWVLAKVDARQFRWLKATRYVAPRIECNSRGDLATHRLCSTVYTGPTFELHLYGGDSGSSAASPHEVAAEIVRHEFSHFLRITLRSPLVRSMERKVVRRLFTGNLSSASSAVGSVDIANYRFRHGLHGSSVCRHIAAGSRSLQIFAALGESSCRIICCSRECLCRL